MGMMAGNTDSASGVPSVATRILSITSFMIHLLAHGKQSLCQGTACGTIAPSAENSTLLVKDPGSRGGPARVRIWPPTCGHQCAGELEKGDLYDAEDPHRPRRQQVLGIHPALPGIHAFFAG